MSTARLKLLLRALALAGVSLFVALIALQGIDEVVSVLAVAGWGLGLLAVWHVVPLALATRGWAQLVDAGAPRPGLLALLRMRWVAESINGLLPVAAVGGDPVRAMLLARREIAGRDAGASVVVDLTVGLFAQMLFALCGLAVLSAYLGGGGLAAPILAGVVVSALVLTAFYLVQRRGLFGGAAGILRRMFGGAVQESWVGGATAVDEAIAGLYRQHARVARAASWRLAGWFAGTGEVWLAAYLFGHPIEPGAALMLESLGGAVRAAAFVVPGALGVQEGSYLLLGGVLGLPPETALAISLAKRVREILLGVPGLLTWQVLEGRRWLRAGRGSAPKREGYEHN